MTKEHEEEKRPLTYYGKKAYRIHQVIVRLKTPETKVPDYRGEDIDEKNGS